MSKANEEVIAASKRAHIALVFLFTVAYAVVAFGQPTTAPTKVSQDQRSNHMSKANELVVNYIAAWNERDPRRRRELVAKTWTEGGTYVDAHRRGVGHEGIDTMI